jgi:hypothetical protein
MSCRDVALAVVCCDGRACLPQAVSTAWNARFNATITEPITEASVRKRATPIVHEKCEVAASRVVYNPLQCRQDRQRQPLRLPVTSLVLSEGELAALRVLLPEPDNIGAALPGEQHEGQCEPRFVPTG